VRSGLVPLGIAKMGECGLLGLAFDPRFQTTGLHLLV